MEYRHFGAIGDILKHLMLCQFLQIEKPQIYCESNSAAALYDMDYGFNKQYGILHFFNNSNKFPDLNNSEYIRLLRIINGNKITKYLGSPGLAMTILGNTCLEYFFSDIDEDSLQNINTFYKKQSMSSPITLNKGDGIKGVLDFLNNKDKNECDKIFVHLDPYNPIENERGRKTAVELFTELVNSGIKVMLWFGIETLKNREMAIKVFKEMQLKTYKPIYTGETILDIISESEAPINPGILGCGILVANLSKNSIECLSKYGRIIEEIYKDAIIDGKYKGSLNFLFDQMLSKSSTAALGGGLFNADGGRVKQEGAFAP
jgi:23S rRNA (adenine2030-N6)-methyltransferase